MTGLMAGASGRAGSSSAAGLWLLLVRLPFMRPDHASSNASSRS